MKTVKKKIAITLARIWLYLKEKSIESAEIQNRVQAQQEENYRRYWHISKGMR